MNSCLSLLPTQFNFPGGVSFGRPSTHQLPWQSGDTDQNLNHACLAPDLALLALQVVLYCALIEKRFSWLRFLPR